MELLFEFRVEVQGISGRTVFFQRPPTIHPEPVLQPDTPADGAGAQLYGSVLRDGGRYRMWYQAVPRDWSGPNPEYVGYAESDDGLAWRKPRLGLVEHAGDGGRNNLVDLVGHSATVFIDPDAPPARRYRAVLCAGTGESAARFGLRGVGYYTASSSDGLKWSMDQTTPQWRHADVITSCHHPGQQRALIALKRHQRFKGIRRRSIWNAEFRNGEWSEAWPALIPDEFDDLAAVARGFDSTDFYGMGMMPAGSGTVGFLWQFRHQLPRVAGSNYGLFGVVDVSLAYQASPRACWQQVPGRPDFIRHEDPPFGQGGVYTASAPIEIGDETRLYFSASTRPHAWQLDDNFKPDPKRLRTLARQGLCRIGYAHWPRGRLFGFRSESGGTLDLNLGRPQPGSRLVLNYRCLEGGSLRADVLSATEGEPERALPLTGDSTGETVTWRAGAVLPAPEAADCIVRLHLDQAEIYAYGLTTDQ